MATKPRSGGSTFKQAPLSVDARKTRPPPRLRLTLPIERLAKAADVGAQGVRAFLGDLDGARADDDAVGEIGRGARLLRRRDPEACVERLVRRRARTLGEAGERGGDAVAAPVVPVTVTR